MIIKKKYLISILFIGAIISATGRDSEAAVRIMMGPNVTMSWASSYLIIDSNSVTVSDKSSWHYATALGLFLDYMTTPYISYRINWICFPSVINKSYDNFNSTKSEINLHDVGFSLLRHLNIDDINLWFGAGLYWQFSTFNNINSYILYSVLSLGFDYEISEDIYLCPEFITGIGMRFIEKSDNEDVVIDVPTGKNFSSNGFVMFFKLGVAKAF
ncbi:MAG: hypothetical protein FWH53_02500 [Leptospirales bacterium]|nr:hypothetical protein [Leptospirales bacterium]